MYISISMYIYIYIYMNNIISTNWQLSRKPAHPKGRPMGSEKLARSRCDMLKSNNCLSRCDRSDLGTTCKLSSAIINCFLKLDQYHLTKKNRELSARCRGAVWGELMVSQGRGAQTSVKLIIIRRRRRRTIIILMIIYFNIPCYVILYVYNTSYYV